MLTLCGAGIALAENWNLSEWSTNWNVDADSTGYVELGKYATMTGSLTNSGKITIKGCDG
jgi:hypothetical protein